MEPRSSESIASPRSPKNDGSDTSNEQPPTVTQHVLDGRSGQQLLADSSKPSVTQVSEATVADPEIVTMLEPYRAVVAERANRIVGRLAEPLTRGSYDDHTSSLGFFLADAMRRETKASMGSEPDMCFTNRGGIRTDLPAGEVTEGTLIEVMPFDNGIVVFYMTGKELEPIVRRITERGDPASGLSYTRRANLSEDITIAGEFIDAKRVYSICTNDYLFEGGGGYQFEGAQNALYTGVLLRDAMIREFELASERQEAIRPATDQRVKVVTE